MKDIKIFFKGVPKGLWVFLGVVFAIICTFPILFTKFPICIFDFSETGQIGDTIGGIMGPFIAILAAVLTFFAFWAQFDANRELIKENRRNHFENRFYKMLDIHLDNVADLNKRVNNTKDDSCFVVWCKEITDLFDRLRKESYLRAFFDDFKKRPNNDETMQEGFICFLNKLESSDIFRERVLFEITYSIFFNNETSTLRFENENNSFYVKEFAALYKDFVTSKTGFSISGYAKNEYLGHYFRHLYQIVKYVVEQPDDLFDEKEWKSGYLSVLRSQMSDSEQMLLYYNAQSSIGCAWNENHFIEDYKLIKNIPYFSIGSCAGIAPNMMYEKAIEAAESKGEKFFERY